LGKSQDKLCEVNGLVCVCVRAKVYSFVPNVPTSKIVKPKITYIVEISQRSRGGECINKYYLKM